MADLRYRTFRMKLYAQVCPPDLEGASRARFMQLLDDLDEDGMVAFFQSVRLSPKTARVVAILKEAREIGDRLNVMDRTLPTLPHPEIGECYTRLRALGEEMGNLLASDALHSTAHP